MTFEEAVEQFKDLIEDSLTETGDSLKGNISVVSVYAALRAEELAELVGDPGFNEAVRAARDAVALRAALAATEEARAVDERLRGLLQGALAFGAAALRGVAPV